MPIHPSVCLFVHMYVLFFNHCTDQNEIWRNCSLGIQDLVVLFLFQNTCFLPGHKYSLFLSFQAHGFNSHLCLPIFLFTHLLFKGKNVVFLCFYRQLCRHTTSEINFYGRSTSKVKVLLLYVFHIFTYANKGNILVPSSPSVCSHVHSFQPLNRSQHIQMGGSLKYGAQQIQHPKMLNLRLVTNTFHHPSVHGFDPTLPFSSLPTRSFFFAGF